MPIQVNGALNGTGSTAAAAPTASEVASAVVAALPAPATVLQGQAVEFEVGKVPADYKQVAGPDTVMAGAWEFAWPSYGHGKGVAGARIYSAGGKLVATYGADTTYVQVLNDDYTPNGSAITLISSYYANHRLVPLANGKLLRIGGYSGYGTSTSTVVQTFDPITRSVATLQSKPTAIGQNHISVEAGNGDVFVFQGTRVDRFSNNVWTENIATVPDTVINAEKLPSGKLLVVCATMQYIYNPATPTQFTAVAVPISVGTNTVCAPSDGGVRVIDLNVTISGLSNTIVAYEYSEAANVFTTLKPYARTPGAITPSYFNFTTKLKDGGALINGASASGLDALVHRISYTPAGTVKAVKL